MVIIDTSIVPKWFDARENDRGQALEILQKHISNEEEIVAPDLLLYEITNVWSTKTHLSQSEIKDNFDKLEKYAIGIIGFDFDLLKQASEFSKKYKVSAYDASYAALASEIGCNLITADAKFAKQVNLPYVKLLKEL